MSKKLLLCGLSIFFCFALMAQRTVTGKVTDPSKTPLSNVSVTVKGSNTGINTDGEGNFSIIIPTGKNILTVSSIGYDPQDVTVVGNPLYYATNILLKLTDGYEKVVN